jgi:hypothetical protein
VWSRIFSTSSSGRRCKVGRVAGFDLFAFLGGFVCTRREEGMAGLEEDTVGRGEGIDGRTVGFVVGREESAAGRVESAFRRESIATGVAEVTAGVV